MVEAAPRAAHHHQMNRTDPSIVSHKQQFEPALVPQPTCAKRQKIEFSSEYKVPNQVTVSEQSVKLCDTDFVCRICLNKVLSKVVEKFRKEREFDSLICEKTLCIKDFLKQVQSADVCFLLNHVSQMIRDDGRSNKKEIDDLEIQVDILSSLLGHKLNDIKLLGMQVDIIKEDLR